MRKLLQELYECERMMKRAAEANNGLKWIPVNPNAQIKPPVTEPSNPGTKTTTASPAVKPAAPPASRPNSTSAPAAPTPQYRHGFVAATHDTEAGPIQMVQRRDGTVDLQLLDKNGNPQLLDPKSRTAYLSSADWDVLPHRGVPDLNGTIYKFHVSPYGITREAVRDGNSTWTQMDPRTGQMRDPDVHFRYPVPEGVNTNSMLLASAPIPKTSLMDGSPSLEVRQFWDEQDKTYKYEYYNPTTEEILSAKSGDAERLRNIVASSPKTRYYELPPNKDGGINYTYDTADGSYLRIRGTDGKDTWRRYHQDADLNTRGFYLYEGAPEGLDPTPSPLKPVTVSEDKSAENPSETPTASQEPTTPSTAEDPEAARRAAYIKDHGARPEWDKAVPAESIWSDPTFQSNTLTGLGVGLLGGLGGYALTGGRGGLAPWLMLGGGISAGISGLSGYNQWNANKTEYEDFLKKQKAWDAGLKALTPVGTLEDGTPVTQGEVASGNVQVVGKNEDGTPLYVDSEDLARRDVQPTAPTGTLSKKDFVFEPTEEGATPWTFAPEDLEVNPETGYPRFMNPDYLIKRPASAYGTDTRAFLFRAVPFMEYVGREGGRGPELDSYKRRNAANFLRYKIRDPNTGEAIRLCAQSKAWLPWSGWTKGNTGYSNNPEKWNWYIQTAAGEYPEITPEDAKWYILNSFKGLSSQDLGPVSTFGPGSRAREIHKTMVTAPIKDWL